MRACLKLKEPITFRSTQNSKALTYAKKLEVDENFRTNFQALVDDLKVYGDSFSAAVGDEAKQKEAIDLVAHEVGRTGNYLFIPGVESAVNEYSKLPEESRSDEAKAKLLEDIVKNFTNEYGISKKLAVALLRLTIQKQGVGEEDSSMYFPTLGLFYDLSAKIHVFFLGSSSGADWVGLSNDRTDAVSYGSETHEATATTTIPLSLSGLGETKKVGELKIVFDLQEENGGFALSFEEISVDLEVDNIVFDSPAAQTFFQNSPISIVVVSDNSLQVDNRTYAISGPNQKMVSDVLNKLIGALPYLNDVKIEKLIDMLSKLNKATIKDLDSVLSKCDEATAKNLVSVLSKCDEVTAKNLVSVLSKCDASVFGDMIDLFGLSYIKGETKSLAKDLIKIVLRCDADDVKNLDDIVSEFRDRDKNRDLFGILSRYKGNLKDAINFLVSCRKILEANVDEAPVSSQKFATDILGWARQLKSYRDIESLTQAYNILVDGGGESQGKLPGFSRREIEQNFLLTDIDAANNPVALARAYVSLGGIFRLSMPVDAAAEGAGNAIWQTQKMKIQIAYAVVKSANIENFVSELLSVQNIFEKSELHGDFARLNPNTITNAVHVLAILQKAGIQLDVDSYKFILQVSQYLTDPNKMFGKFQRKFKSDAIKDDERVNNNLLAISIDHLVRGIRDRSVSAEDYARFADGRQTHNRVIEELISTAEAVVEEDKAKIQGKIAQGVQTVAASSDLSENLEETRFFVRLVSPVDPADMGQNLKKAKEELRDRGVVSIEEFVTASCAAPAASSGGESGQRVLLLDLQRRGVQVSGEGEYKVIEFTGSQGGQFVDEAPIPKFVTDKLLKIAQAFDGDQGLTLDMYRMIDGQSGQDVYYTDSHKAKHAIGFFINSELMNFFRGSLAAIDGSVKFSVVGEKTLIRRKKGENDALLIEFLHKFKHESDGSTAECSVIVEAKRVKNAAGMYVGVEISIVGANLDAALTQSGHADGMKKDFFALADNANIRNIFADYRPIVQNQAFITLQKDRLTIARGRGNPEIYAIPGPNYKVIGDALSKLVDILPRLNSEDVQGLISVLSKCDVRTADRLANLLPKLDQEDIKGLISVLSKCDARTAGVVIDILVTLNNVCKEEQFKLLCSRFINELNKSERLEGGYSAIEGVLKQPELQKVPTIINDPKVSRAFFGKISANNTEMLLFLSRFGTATISIIDGFLITSNLQGQDAFVTNFLTGNSKAREEIVNVLLHRENIMVIFASLQSVLHGEGSSEQDLAGVLSKKPEEMEKLLEKKLARMDDKSTAKKCMKLLFGKSSSILLRDKAQFVSVMLQSDEGTANLAMKFAVKYQESFIRFFNALGDRGVVSSNLLHAYTKLLEAKSAKQAKQTLASWTRLVKEFGSLNVKVNEKTLLESTLRYRNPEVIEVVTKINRLYSQLEVAGNGQIAVASLIERLEKTDATRLQDIMKVLDNVLHQVKHVENPDNTIGGFLKYILDLREDQKSVSAVVARVINFDQFNAEMFTKLQGCYAKNVVAAFVSSEKEGIVERWFGRFRHRQEKNVLGDFVGKAVPYYAKQVEEALGLFWNATIGEQSCQAQIVTPAAKKQVTDYLATLPNDQALIFKKALMQILDPQKQIDTRDSCIIALNKFCAKDPAPAVDEIKGFVDKVVDVCELAYEKISPANMADVITNMGKSNEDDRQNAIGVIVSIGGNSNEDKAARGIFVRQTAAKDSLPVGMTYKSLATGFKNTFTALRDRMSLNELARIFTKFPLDVAAKLFDGDQEHNETILSLKNVSDIELISQVQNIVRVHGESSTRLTLEATGPVVGPSNAAGAVAAGIIPTKNKDDVVEAGRPNPLSTDTLVPR